MSSSVSVLGVHVDSYTKEAFSSRVATWLSAGTRGHLITTPNAEMILAAQHNPQLREVLNRSDIALCDSRAVQWAALPVQIQRYTGVDACADLLSIAEDSGYSVFFLGGGSAALTHALQAALARSYPALRIAGMNEGPNLSVIDNHVHIAPEDETQLLLELQVAAPDILCVAFSHEKQELFLAQYLPRCPSIRIGIGVGGAFSYLSGKSRRAPALWRRVGIEWLWRLLAEPHRWRRIIRAVIVFPYNVLRTRYFSSH